MPDMYIPDFTGGLVGGLEGGSSTEVEGVGLGTSSTRLGGTGGGGSDGSGGLSIYSPPTNASGGGVSGVTV